MLIRNVWAYVKKPKNYQDMGGGGGGVIAGGYGEKNIMFLNAKSNCYKYQIFLS